MDTAFQPWLAAWLVPLLLLLVLVAMAHVLRCSQSLQGLRRELARAHTAYAALNRELEARVVQRTAELERLSTTDPLTDAHNRRFLMARAEIELALAKRQGHAVSMVMFDIDHFKRINDSHGHNTGDRVLVVLSQAVRQALRPGDTFARVGGEEFVMLLPRSDAAQALLVAERMRAMVATLDVRVSAELVLRITASFGVATTEPDIATVDALYVAADTALYQAKGAGRNCVVAHPARAYSS